MKAAGKKELQEYVSLFLSFFFSFFIKNLYNDSFLEGLKETNGVNLNAQPVVIKF